MQTEDKTFLGRGWQFPPAFQEQTATVSMAVAEEDIQQSLYLLLSTTPGERFLRPRYGCDLMSLVFERYTPATRNRIVDLITMAILWYEPRITLETIDVRQRDALDGLVEIYLEYTVRKTNTRSNMVYPFYLKEGTNL